MKLECSLFPLLFNTVLEVGANAIFFKKKITRNITIRKKDIELYLLADDTVIYLVDILDDSKRINDTNNKTSLVRK